MTENVHRWKGKTFRQLTDELYERIKKFMEEYGISPAHIQMMLYDIAEEYEYTVEAEKV